VSSASLLVALSVFKDGARVGRCSQMSLSYN